MTTAEPHPNFLHAYLAGQYDPSPDEGPESRAARPCVYDEGGVTYPPWCYMHDRPHWYCIRDRAGG